jgi:hypothetical protein
VKEKLLRALAFAVETQGSTDSSLPARLTLSSKSRLLKIHLIRLWRPCPQSVASTEVFHATQFALVWRIWKVRTRDAIAEKSR